MPKIATQLSKAQSNKVNSLRARIEKLRAELDALGSSTSKPAGKRGAAKSPAKAKSAKSGKRVMSAEARAKIAEAQRRRWAKARRKK